MLTMGGECWMWAGIAGPAGFSVEGSTLLRLNGGLCCTLRGAQPLLLASVAPSSRVSEALIACLVLFAVGAFVGDGVPELYMSMCPYTSP